MIEVNIPGFGDLLLEHLVLDYNGTLALDGKLLPGVPEVLGSLTPGLTIHIVTADTFGLAAKQLARLPVELTILHQENQQEAKHQFIRKLGPQSVVAIGNGRNDARMLKEAAIGIAVVQREGAAASALASSDIVANSFWEALELLRNPRRIIATLRS
jgi:P-type E1-E2 ATPase